MLEREMLGLRSCILRLPIYSSNSCFGLVNVGSARGGKFLAPTAQFSLQSSVFLRSPIRAGSSRRILTVPLSPAKIEEWVGALNQNDQQLLLAALQKQLESQNTSDPSPVTSVTSKQLLHVGLICSLPFIGFGFLDNFIMIIAGDYIDLTIGTALGISTMAAAALGNAISDVAGIGSAWYVESLTNKLGVPQPNLDPRQMAKTSTRWAINIGRAVGVALGCILGMVPLLILPTADEKERNKHKNNND